MTTNEGTPKEIASLEKSKVTELDVRPILNSGGEPFSAIMSAIGKTPSDGALKLRATFKPTPLFHALGAQGWQHWIERGEGDDWTVWFYRSGQGQPAPAVTKAELGAARLQKEDPELQRRLKAEGDTWYLDVRTLSPPEPMELTLSVLESLPNGASLVQINERVPRFLLPLLLERGFHYTINETREEVRLKIGRVAG